MVLVLDKCAEILGSKVSALRNRLNHPIDRAHVMTELQGRTARTTYSENGFDKTFVIGRLSLQGADWLMAYGPLPRPYAINVAGYYHCKFGIRLKYPFTCCVVERFPMGGEDRYFPLELIELVETDNFCIQPSTSKLPTWLGGNLFTEVKPESKKRLDWNSSHDNSDVEDAEDIYAGGGCDMLSQDPIRDPIDEMTW